MYANDITACSTVDDGTSGAVVKSNLAAHLDSLGVADAEQTWTDRPRGWEVSWDVPGGSITVSLDGTWVMAIYRPMDPCEEWRGEDPFYWAKVAFGSTGMATFGKVNMCVGFDKVDEYGQTPLMYAISADNNMTVGMLLSVGLDPNHRTHAGWTPILYAARDASDMVVTRLLEAGAEPTIVAPDGTTAAALASGNPKISTQVRAALAPPPPRTAANHGTWSLEQLDATGVYARQRLILHLGSRSRHSSDLYIGCRPNGDPEVFIDRGIEAHGSPLPNPISWRLSNTGATRTYWSSNRNNRLLFMPVAEIPRFLAHAATATELELLLNAGTFIEDRKTADFTGYNSIKKDLPCLP